MDRFEQNTPATLTLSLKIANVPTDVDVGTTVDVVVTDGAGAVIRDDIAAHAGTGLYEFQLTEADTAVLDTFKAEWRYTQGGRAQVHRRRFRTVGAFYCSLDELRNFGANKTLADPDEFGDQMLINKRELAEELLEDECHDVFSQQGRRVVINGNSQLLLPFPLPHLRRVVSGTVNRVPMDVTGVQVFGRDLYRPTLWPYGIGNISLFVEVGWDEIPERIREATMHIVRDRCEQKDMIDERATSLVNQQGTQQLSVAGKDGPTGIPFVDATIKRYDSREKVASVSVASEYPRNVRLGWPSVSYEDDWDYW